MSDERILKRIEAWEAAGLIDADAAARLREHETTAADDAAGPARGLLASFGPVPTIAEVFAYLGGGFILAAWYTLVGAQVSGTDEDWPTLAAMTGVVAVIAIVLGVALRGRGAQPGRGAGVLFAVGVANVAAVGYYLGTPVLPLYASDRLAVAALGALATAMTLRRLHAGLLTQATLVGAIAGLAAAVSGAIATHSSGWAGAARTGIVVDLVIWALAALFVGIVALLESRRTGADAARRLALTRFGAGFIAVVASAATLMRSGEINSFTYDRFLEPWTAELGIVLVSLGILALAIRRGATPYLYPAALGIVIALTDANSRYVADQAGTGVALLIEGVVLLFAGFGADRIRRRLSAAPVAAVDGPQAEAPSIG